MAKYEHVTVPSIQLGRLFNRTRLQNCPALALISIFEKPRMLTSGAGMRCQEGLTLSLYTSIYCFNQRFIYSRHNCHWYARHFCHSFSRVNIFRQFTGANADNRLTPQHSVSHTSTDYSHTCSDQFIRHWTTNRALSTTSSDNLHCNQITAVTVTVSQSQHRHA